MSFLEVARGHTHVGRVKQISDFRDFIYLFSESDAYKIIKFSMTWRWIFLKSRKFRSGLCVTLPTLRMTAYYFEERNFITAHLILTQYSVLRLKYVIIPVLLTLIYFLIFPPADISLKISPSLNFNV